MTVGVTGASGHLGRLVIQTLATRVPAANILALARTTAKAAGLGVAVREADYDRPETLVVALKGIDTLLLISASEVGKRQTEHHNVIEAARKAGVKRVVYTSLLRADTSPIGLASEHIATEREIEASGIPHTFLRNGWYNENYIGSIEAALAHGTLLGCAGTGKISSAARADYADAAVEAVVDAAHVGKTYELAGDESWTLADLAAELSRQSGKTILYHNVSESEYAATLQASGVPKPMAELVAGWDTGTAQGGLFDNTRQLSRLIGHPTTPMSELVRAVVRS
ncbi:MAG: SDR family oxidoreductase, partial [Tepidiformaceae bacterium]